MLPTDAYCNILHHTSLAIGQGTFVEVLMPTAPSAVFLSRPGILSG
jgi:hypothetical protein